MQNLSLEIDFLIERKCHMKFESLNIDGLLAKLPIIQGGMGVGVSLSNLAGAVAAEGGIGVISAAQPGFNLEGFELNSFKANLTALADHIKAAKEKSIDGLIGVNIMCASRKYEEYVKCCVESKADLIISGAGLPINLPEIIGDAKTKIAPIVSSLKAAKVLLKMWENRYKKTADMVVIEGPKAGGHLGFTPEEAKEAKPMDDEIKAIVNHVSTYEDKFNKKIPVVFAGGVFDKNDIAHTLSLGVSGVQIASRFVATDECDAHINFKNAYVNAKKEDIVIVKSPVGMPGRALLNNFIKGLGDTRENITKCYACLKNCDYKVTPYCISKALITAVKGDVDNGLVFCGSETHRIDKITTVKELISELLG